MYELVIVWETGETEVHKYNTEAEAQRAGENMKRAFGEQVQWYGTRKYYRKGEA